MLGIIGQNGTGKSTLLKILSGIMIPGRVTVQVVGTVTGFLELDSGFNERDDRPREYLHERNAHRGEIGWKKQTIIDFSERGDFINELLKTSF
jgi:ABC-type polysaccharide/polyol phosphate transport system ATPase subunit